MKLKTHRDVKHLIGELIKDGWGISNKNNHVKIYSPDGILRTVCGSSLSDVRGIKNIQADIRRARVLYDKSANKDIHMETGQSNGGLLL